MRYSLQRWLKFALIHPKIIKETVLQFKMSNFVKFCHISSIINIFTTRVVFHHFVSFSSETQSFGAYQWVFTSRMPLPMHNHSVKEDTIEPRGSCSVLMVWHLYT